MKSHKTEKMEVSSAKSLEFLRKQSFREKNENFLTIFRFRFAEILSISEAYNLVEALFFMIDIRRLSVKFTKYLERFFRKQLERFKTAELFSLFIPRENVRFSDVSRGLNREHRALMGYKVGITFFPKTKH